MALASTLNGFIKGMADEDYLFKSREGANKPLSRFAAYKIIRAAASSVGLSQIGTHSLRKTLAYHIYAQTRDIGLVMGLLRHSSPRTTLRYIGLTQEVEDATLDRFGM